MYVQAKAKDIRDLSHIGLLTPRHQRILRTEAHNV